MQAVKQTVKPQRKHSNKTVKLMVFMSCTLHLYRNLMKENDGVSTTDRLYWQIKSISLTLALIEASSFVIHLSALDKSQSKLTQEAEVRTGKQPPLVNPHRSIFPSWLKSFCVWPMYMARYWHVLAPCTRSHLFYLIYIIPMISLTNPTAGFM